MELDTLIERMHRVDKQYKRANKILQMVFFIFIFFYGGFFLINTESELTLNHRIAGVCYVIAFTLFFFVFRKNYRKYKEVNYADPVKKVLENAEKRYRFWQKDTFNTISGIIFIDIATCFMLLPRIGSFQPFASFILIQLFILLAFAVGFSIGYFKWKRELKPLWLSSKELLKELKE